MIHTHDQWWALVENEWDFIFSVIRNVYNIGSRYDEHFNPLSNNFEDHLLQLKQNRDSKLVFYLFSAWAMKHLIPKNNITKFMDICQQYEPVELS